MDPGSGDGITEQEIQNTHEMAISGAGSSWNGAQDFSPVACLCLLFSPQTCIIYYECGNNYECGNKEMNFWSTGKMNVSTNYCKMQNTIRVIGKVQCVIKNEKSFPL